MEQAQEQERSPGEGILVAIEGIDGAGTTTQARLLVERLRRMGRLAHLTRQPSDGVVGRHIRQQILAADGSADRRSLALLFAADRLDHLQREVLPQLAQGAVVVSDRWYHSSLAYQARSTVELGWVAGINLYARAPDLTIFLRVTPELAADRRAAAGRPVELFDDGDTQRVVAAMYDRAIEFVRDRGERVRVLDGSRSALDLHEEITADVLGADLWYATDTGAGAGGAA